MTLTLNRITRHAKKLAALVSGGVQHETSERDAFSVHKYIVAVTRSGMLVALDNQDGHVR